MKCFLLARIGTASHPTCIPSSQSLGSRCHNFHEDLCISILQARTFYVLFISTCSNAIAELIYSSYYIDSTRLGVRLISQISKRLQIRKGISVLSQHIYYFHVSCTVFNKKSCICNADNNSMTFNLISMASSFVCTILQVAIQILQALSKLAFRSRVFLKIVSRMRNNPQSFTTCTSQVKISNISISADCNLCRSVNGPSCQAPWAAVSSPAPHKKLSSHCSL